MLLKSRVDLQASVTDFLPQLRNPRSKLRWEDITLQMLADNLAGIPPNAFYEFYFLNTFHESLGLPHLDDSDYPSCGVAGLNSGCNKEQYIQNLLDIEQVVPANSRPVYSSLSFAIFTLCLEAHTGKNYSQILRETIYEPLGLTSSGVSPGSSERAVIPPSQSQWGSDYGLNAPGGGLYSSTNDISVLLSTTLNKSILDTPADVRHWLKPQSTTGSSDTLVGRPWEIFRTSDLLPSNEAHTVNIYAKSGGALGYMSQIAVIDQYGVGLAVLTAGPIDSASILYRAILSVFIPAIEEEARSQARRYTGTWTSRVDSSTAVTRNSDSHSDSTSNEHVNISLTLDDRPGLKLTSLTRGNSSIIDAIRTIWEAEFFPLGFGVLLADDFRLYPTELETPVPPAEASALLSQLQPYNTRDFSYNHTGKGKHDDGMHLTRQEWRINFDIAPVDGSISDIPGQNVATQYCGSWQVVDWMTYGGIGLDKIVFVVDESKGEVLGVEVPALRAGVLIS